MPRFDEAFVQEVRERTDIVALIGEYVHLTRRGNRYWGLCPFHSEKTPSFSVNPERQMYYCFGCKAAGDVFRFVMEREHLTFYEAVVQLAARAGLSPPRAERSPEEERRARERQELLDALEFAARFFEHQLLHSPAGRRALEYLHGRGLDETTIRRFRLGYAPDRWDALLRAAGHRFSPEVLARAGLVQPKDGGGYYDRFRHRVMFPIADVRGRVVAFGGRALEPDQVPKYYNSPEGPLFSKRSHLYGLHLAREAMRAGDLAIVVEGYMDTIALHQAGFPAAVASLGTSLTREQAELLRRQCGRAIIAYDADLAGQAATLRGLDLLVQAGLEVRVLRLPQGKDPDELVRSAGPEAVRQALEEALPLIEFKIRSALERHRGAGNPAEVRAAVIRDVIPILASVADPVLQDQYIRQAAHWMADWQEVNIMTEEALRQALQRHVRRQPGERDKQRRNWNNIKVLEEPLVRIEREALRVLLHRPDLLGQAGDLRAHEWSSPLHAAVYAAIAAAGEEPAAGGIVARALAQTDDPEARALIAQLEREEAMVGQPARVLEGVLESIRELRDQRRRQELERIVREREAAGQTVEPAILLELTELRRRIRRPQIRERGEMRHGRLQGGETGRP
ncbi:DNA primase [Caldinitratiruptor microaerophilus]|uniref:DNA primase n=1 Tax=Caldinitratiruptor microaerophilus TaxID=671077 RepID=A0AA35GAJ4_9FIRM|nr:DNA primase [Caldinitratiruptor microaerophilus]BDG61369.1 hypothetical protein caldi_24590 [Caldinitratiruptor microaerophilus]